MEKIVKKMDGKRFGETKATEYENGKVVDFTETTKAFPEKDWSRLFNLWEGGKVEELSKAANVDSADLQRAVILIF
jgi:Mor family transcriptional regulator